jgi:hypothetical protein
MPKFMKNNTIVTVSKSGLETERRVLFTAEEMVERITENPSLVIEVTESHAAQVLRPQQKYQEVSEAVLALAHAPDADDEDEVPSPAPEVDVDEDDIEPAADLSFGKKK